LALAVPSRRFSKHALTHWGTNATFDVYLKKTSAITAVHNGANEQKRNRLYVIACLRVAERKNMMYDESIEESAERLRLALPLMSKNGVAMNPQNYTVWYEYVAGANERLKRDIETHLQRDQRVGNEATKQLYQKYFACQLERKLEPVQKTMREIVSVLLGYVGEIGDQANKYGDALTHYISELQADLAVRDVERILEALVSHTQSLQSAQSSMRRRLNESTTELERLRLELQAARREAATDPLTGLLNRKGLEAAIEQAILERPSEGAPLCLLMIDIDHFKRINDQYGHLLGDKVLRLVGATLSQSIKGRDTAGRYGGEEFAVLLPDTPLEGARTLADQIRMAIAAGRILRMDNRQPIGQVTVSIGLTAYRLGEEPAQLLQRADEALYQSKRSGRNCVTVKAMPK
jgi:diguanylate cyclase